MPARGMLGAAHKPGAMPLRPLGLGDMYDAAFRIIRFNPKATVGSAVLVAAVAFLVPVVVTAALSFVMDLSLDGGASGDDTNVVGLVGSVGSLGLGSVLVGFGTILVTGMIAHVTAAAAVGRRLTLGEAWAATRGKRWRLIGLAFLLGFVALLLVGAYALLWVLVVVTAGDNVAPVVIWGLLSVPAFGCLMVYFWVRVYYLPVPALMLEPVGVFGALARGYSLTRKQFWRTFGIALLTLLVVGIAANFLGLPIGIIGQVAAFAVPPRFALLVLVVTQALTQVVTAAFTTPFTSAVTSLQYLDQRMRKEAYDVELMQQAGITAS
jgi:Membrane domain of glycerophosphoryl diester phosphodiesterase